MNNGIYDRVKALCDEKGITIARLESNCGLANATIKKWKAINNPSVDKIRVIAEYFDVTVDYLLGMTEIRTPVDKLANDEDIISLQRAKSKMLSNDWQRAMRMLRAGFQEAFCDDDN